MRHPVSRSEAAHVEAGGQGRTVEGVLVGFTRFHLALKQEADARAGGAVHFQAGRAVLATR